MSQLKDFKLTQLLEIIFDKNAYFSERKRTYIVQYWMANIRNLCQKGAFIQTLIDFAPLEEGYAEPLCYETGLNIQNISDLLFHIQIPCSEQQLPTDLSFGVAVG